MIYAVSRKQKCVSKSPMESELIALSDEQAVVELVVEFLTFLGFEVAVPVIY
jgi:hypothetical protein